MRENIIDRIRLRRSSLVLALAAALAVGSTTTPALAAGSFVDAIGGPTQVEYPGLFMIQYQGINYMGTQSTQTCSNGPNVSGQSIDTIRFWNSLAQAALLAGKTMRIYYTACTQGGTTNNYIGDLVLEK